MHRKHSSQLETMGLQCPFQAKNREPGTWGVTRVRGRYPQWAQPGSLGSRPFTLLVSSLPR